MAAKLLVVVLAAAAATMCSGALVRRDAPAAPTPLEELQKHVLEFQKTVSEQFNKLVSTDNTKELNKALEEGSSSVLQQLSALSTSLQAALGDANGKAKEALEQMRASVQRTAEELRRAHPDVEQRAGEMRDKLQAAVQATLTQTQTLAKQLAANVEETNKQLAPKVKAAYDDFVKQAEAVQKKLHDAANKQ